MGRIRTIKPEFFTHESLFDAEQETGLPIRLAFAGLWTQCDREGRFLWRPRMLKTAIMPYDEVDFARVLDALLTRGFVVRYASDGREIGMIPSWHRHQVINNRETASILPPPSENIEEFDASATRGARVGHAASGEGKGKEGKEAPNGALSVPSAPTTSAKPKSRNEYPSDFEEAWKAYPTHSGMSKAEALPHWRKLSVEDRAKVLPSIAGYAAFLKTKPDLEVVHFCRYLSKRRFEGFTHRPPALPVSDADWNKRLLFARNRKIWSETQWGPRPGTDGCPVPPELLMPGDGEGWVEQPRAA